MMMQRAALAAASFRSLANRAVTTNRSALAAFANNKSSPFGVFGSLSNNYPNGHSCCWMSTDVDVPPPPTSHHKHIKVPNASAQIIYTETDEAPALATYSLYPAVAKIGALAGIDIVPCDISVAARVLALFPEKLKPDQRVPDNLAYLGELAKTPDANIIKLPNSKFFLLSRSIDQKTMYGEKF
jgi:hypothetical protein